MTQIPTDSRIRGLTFRRKKDNKTLTAFGCHKDGLRELLTFFGVSPDLQAQVLDDAKTDWVNMLIIERSQEHPKGYTHFCVKSVKYEGDSES